MKVAWVLSYPFSAAKTLISLGGCPSWSESSHTPRLIWVFAGRTCHFVSFVMRRLKCDKRKKKRKTKKNKIKQTNKKKQKKKQTVTVWLQESMIKYDLWIPWENHDDHEGIVSIGGRLITNFHFADSIVVNIVWIRKELTSWPAW